MTDYETAVTQVQEHYRKAAEVRARGFDGSSARAYFRDYVNFVSLVAPRGRRVLDVGCGSGWSSMMLARAGFPTVGLDVVKKFEVEPEAGLEFRTGSAEDLPFPANSFDVVCAYQVLEHIPDPVRALQEFSRVVRPGGFVCIVGPNLLSPALSLRSIFWWVWQNRPVSRIFVRAPDMPRHPTGNTLPEAVYYLLTNCGRLLIKLATTEPHLSLRTPDTKPPFQSDNDACYLCNPIDLSRYYRKLRYDILFTAKPTRPTWSGSLLGGTWFAARKPDAVHQGLNG
jgi:SAM-dependent methyltransferase